MYLMVSWSYGLAKTDEALNLLNNGNSGVRHGNDNNDCCKNDPRTPNIYVSNCSCHFPSIAVSLDQDSMPLPFLCELKKSAMASSHISSQVPLLVISCTTVSFMAQVLMVQNKFIELKGGIIKRFYVSPDLK